MIEWLTVASVAVVVAVGLISVVSGIRGNPPRDLTVLGTLSVAGVLVVLMMVAIVQPLVGNPAGGDALEAGKPKARGVLDAVADALAKVMVVPEEGEEGGEGLPGASGQ